MDADFTLKLVGLLAIIAGCIAATVLVIDRKRPSAIKPDSTAITAAALKKIQGKETAPVEAFAALIVLADLLSEALQNGQEIATEMQLLPDGSIIFSLVTKALNPGQKPHYEFKVADHGN